MQPRTQTMTLREVIANMSERNTEEWYVVMGIEIPGMDEARKRAVSDDADEANAGFDETIRLEEKYIEENGDSLYEVTWPQHVYPPKAWFDSDAWYRCVRDLGKKSQFVSVVVDDENNAEKFWENFRESMPVWAKVLSSTDSGEAVRIPVSAWESIQKIEGFADGPNYARTAIMIEEADE